MRGVLGAGGDQRLSALFQGTFRGASYKSRDAEINPKGGNRMATEHKAAAAWD
jgi:hypothetical protein